VGAPLHGPAEPPDCPVLGQVTSSSHTDCLTDLLGKPSATPVVPGQFRPAVQTKEAQ
jgi:hypothetical protein